MNLLAAALTLIPPTTVQHLVNTGVTTNAAGLKVPAFAAPVGVPGSHVQPVKTSRYEQLGLDWKARYVTWYAPAPVMGVRREMAGDQFTHGGKLYNVVGETDWFGYDGWCVIIGQAIGNA